MIGLVARLAAAARDGVDDVEEVDGEGVIWVDGNECRTCREPIEDVETAPTAVDLSDPIANLAAGETGQPRSAFCSEECREEFLEVFDR